MKDLDVLISLVNKLIKLGMATKAEIYAAEDAIKRLESKLPKEDDTTV